MKCLAKLAPAAAWSCTCSTTQVAHPAAPPLLHMLLIAAKEISAGRPQRQHGYWNIHLGTLHDAQDLSLSQTMMFLHTCHTNVITFTQPAAASLR